MKRICLILVVLVLVCSGSLLAQTFSAICSSSACLPFNPSNSYVAQLAVNVAASHNAPVGSTIVISYFPPPGNLCDERDLEWTVNHIPTLNSSNLTFEEAYCDVAGK